MQTLTKPPAVDTSFAGTQGDADSKARQDGLILAHLRVATRPAHERLESTMGLLSEQLTLKAYQNVIKRFYGFWIDWQPHVAALLRDEALLEPRRRLYLLEADLAALGVSVDEVAALPRCPLPVLRDAAEALGSLYVMEGSTLGGRVIERHVERHLGLGGQSGCAYFTGYGAGTGAMWRAFLARLDTEPAERAERIGNGASATFDCLAGWFNLDLQAGKGGNAVPA